MKKVLIGLAAAAAIAAPIATAATAEAAPAKDAKATGDVAWTVDLSKYGYGTVTGTTRFDANNKTGGSLDYTNSVGYFLHATVTPGTVVKSGNTITFSGVLTSASPEYNGGTGTYDAVVTDNGEGSKATGPDKIAVFVNESDLDGIRADVTSGNLQVH